MICVFELETTEHNEMPILPFHCGTFRDMLKKKKQKASIQRQLCVLTTMSALSRPFSERIANKLTLLPSPSLFCDQVPLRTEGNNAIPPYLCNVHF